VIEPGDDLAIRNMVAASADAVTARQLDVWRAFWAPDGVWQIGDRVVEGSEDIAHFLSGALERFPRLVQTAFAGRLAEDVDGRVVGVWPVLEIQHAGASDERLLVGQYDDIYTKVQGRWLFARRQFTAIYRGAVEPGLQERS
jgi:hypothetical protein